MTEQRNKKKPFYKTLLIVVASALFFGLLASCGLLVVRYIFDGKTESDIPKQVLEGADQIAEHEGSESPVVTDIPAKPVSATDISTIADGFIPAIAAVNATTVSKVADLWGNISNYKNENAGSGIIIGQNEYELFIVTNTHVIDEAEKITVTFIDKTEHEATVKGSDLIADIAVLSVPRNSITKETADTIRIATLGESDRVKTGSFVIAIGNSLGIGQSVTVGYISAVDREVTVENQKMTLLQTDAAINPGNDGGALLNVNGEVIGINSVRFSSVEVEGMGYAIPISDAIPIIDELMNREELTQQEAGYFGVEGKDVTMSYSQLFGMPIGVYVNKIDSNSPADEAGIHVGDIIISINRRTVMTAEEMDEMIDHIRAGVEISVQMQTLQDGNYVDKEVMVTLGRR